MSQKLEQILDLLLAEENEKAEELLHEFVVSKAREQYESILDEEADEEVEEAVEETDEEAVEETVDEVIDQTSDFEDDIIADEIGEEEDEADMDMDSEDEEGDEEGDLEDKVDELEAELDSLKAEFDALMADEMDEPEHADMGDDAEEAEMDMEEESVEYDLDEETEEDDEVVEEATKLSNAVAAPKAGATEKTDSPLTKKPKATTVSGAGTPVKAKDGATGDMGNNKAKDHTPTSNIGVTPKKA